MSCDYYKIIMFYKSYIEKLLFNRMMCNFNEIAKVTLISYSKHYIGIIYIILKSKS